MVGVAMNEPYLPQLEAALDTWPRWQVALRERPRVVRELSGGFTNRSWLLESDQGSCVLRLNSPHDAHFNIDRQREKIILEAVSRQGLAPALWCCEPFLGFLVTDYIAGQPLEEAIAQKQQTTVMTSLIARIQAVSLELPRFDYWQHLQHYENVLNNLGVAVPVELNNKINHNSDVLRTFQQSGWQPVLVHHDLNPQNLFVVNGEIVVIDWEYAAMGYGGMDRADAENLPLAVSLLKSLINDYWWLLKSSLQIET
jgi:aminoglycoside phosphotransferase (APT) family kinase protein